MRKYNVISVVFIILFSKNNFQIICQLPQMLSEITAGNVEKSTVAFCKLNFFMEY